MPAPVVDTAMLTCSFGTTPSSLAVVPAGPRVTALGLALASVVDFVPQSNIKPFGMCTTVSNPQVASATSAALGVLTPQPCVPAIAAPWTPGAATVSVNGRPALTDSCTCQCMWGGAVTITNAGQSTATAT
jgi:uncharacterized protein DUF4280